MVAFVHHWKFPACTRDLSGELVNLVIKPGYHYGIQLTLYKYKYSSLFLLFYFYDYFFFT